MTDIEPHNPQSYEALLHFYAEAGVVDLLDDEPIDRFAQTIELAEKRRQQLGLRAKGSNEANQQNNNRSQNQNRQVPNPSQNLGQNQRQNPNQGFAMGNNASIPDQTAIDMAVYAAKNAENLDALKAAITKFEACNLRNGAKHTVFADGNPKADIMFIGEAPQGPEDRQGIPFVGDHGQLFDKMLAAIKLDRSNSYITNMIPWRPPGNRNPTTHEINLCLPFLKRHIELMEPKLLVLLGNISTIALLQSNSNILSLRGKWAEYSYGDVTIPVMPSLHPTYLLRNPAAKRNSWADLLAISAKLNAISTTPEN